MGVLKALLWPFQTWNEIVLPIGRWIAIVAIACMVAAILIQVFFRYVLNNALPWPDEAARFMMLWMTGLIAPMAYRRGGFVAIDMLEAALPKAAAAVLSLVLLAIAGAVLAAAVWIGWFEVTGFGGNFATASLYIPGADLGICEPLGLKPQGTSGWCRIPRSWMMASFFVGMVLLLIVNIELVLRNLMTLAGEEPAPIKSPEEELMAE